jgi:AhpD family alkylhydroperoxidase
MTRIPPVAPAEGGPLVRVAYREARRQIGVVPEPVAVMAHHRPTLLAYGALETGVDRSRRVDQRLKELAWLKAATMIGCAWCIDYGSSELPRLGVTPEQLADVPNHRESDRFSDVEKLVLDLAEAMTVTPVDVSDELFDALRAHFDEAQLVELTFAIAVENLRGRFNWALGIGSQGFCEAPVAAAPA